MNEIKKALERVLLRVQKPARYIGGEPGGIIKDRFAFCFPDLYEVGMSHLGMKILYSLMNEKENMWCERVFAPDIDFEEIMRSQGIPLYALESLDPLKNFDIIGFTLQYELSFPTVLNMLDLAGLPVRAAEGNKITPLIVAGGPCACNPEPLADFIDLFLLGEGEEMNLELAECLIQAKKEGLSKEEFLWRAAKIEDGQEFDRVYYPENFVVPFIQTVHDRAMVEVLRGCIRGCRFCQAGFIYRPLREKCPGTINTSAKALCSNTGYDEVSLTSLSTRVLTPWSHC